MMQRDEKRERLNDYQEQYGRLIAEGYTAKDRTISVLKANVMALVTAGPFAVLAVVLYLNKWGGNAFSFDVNLVSVGLFVLAFIVSIPLHEALHGFAWSLVAKNGWKSIRFGILRPSYTPYCHCKEPLGFWAYLFGALTPFLALAVGAFLSSYASGSLFWLLFSVVHFIAAGGDTTLVCMMLPYTKAQFLDHPSECGFTAFVENM